MHRGKTQGLASASQIASRSLCSSRLTEMSIDIADDFFFRTLRFPAMVKLRLGSRTTVRLELVFAACPKLRSLSTYRRFQAANLTEPFTSLRVLDAQFQRVGGVSDRRSKSGREALQVLQMFPNLRFIKAGFRGGNGVDEAWVSALLDLCEAKHALVKLGWFLFHSCKLTSPPLIKRFILALPKLQWIRLSSSDFDDSEIREWAKENLPERHIDFGQQFDPKHPYIPIADLCGPRDAGLDDD